MEAASIDQLSRRIVAPLNSGRMRLSGHVVFCDGIAIGVLNPGTLFGVDEHDLPCVYGPAGKVRIEKEEASDTWAAIIASGSLLFGSVQDASAVSELLESERTSRTTSYLCSALVDCGSVLAASRTLRASTVSILGCGGIGSLACVLLAGAGVKRLVVVDPDLVEASNLNRQILWTRQDVGRPKVEAIAERICERFDDVDVAVHRERISPGRIAEFVVGAAAILLTADSPIGLVHNVYFAIEDSLLVTCGYTLGEAGLATYKRGREPQQGRVRWFPGPAPIMPSFGPTNAELAGMATSLIVQYVCRLPSCSEPQSLSWQTAHWPRQFE